MSQTVTDIIKRASNLERFAEVLEKEMQSPSYRKSPKTETRWKRLVIELNRAGHAAENIAAALFGLDDLNEEIVAEIKALKIHMPEGYEGEPQ